MAADTGRQVTDNRKPMINNPPLRNPATSILGLLLAACLPMKGTWATASEPNHPEVPVIYPTVRIQAADGSVPTDVAILGTVGGRSEAIVFAALGEGGLAWYDERGRELGRKMDIDARHVEVLNDASLVVVADGRDSTLRLFSLDDSATGLAPSSLAPPATEDEITGLCHGYSALADAWYLFAVTDDGLIHQWSLDRAGSRPARHLRSLAAGKGVGHCAVDPTGRRLFVVHESLGVWRTGAEPESDPAFEFLALAEPHGALGDDLKGLAWLPGPDGAGHLLVSDAGAGHIAVLDDASGDTQTRFTLSGLGEAEGMALDWIDGAPWLALADEDEAPGARAVLLLDLGTLDGILDPGLPHTTAHPSSGNRPATVRPVTESDPVNTWGDAADDPAIWVHPTEPARSLVLGSQKQGGIHLYDLQGRELQFLDAGRINNVDLRDGFPFDGDTVTLVAGSDRSRDGVTLFLLDGEARRLSPLPGGFIPTDLRDPYGLCMYRSNRDGSFQVIVNDSHDGRALQFRVEDNGEGGIRHELLRAIPVGAQAEGCVADDETGALFIAEEEYGIWKYSAEAADGLDRVQVDDFTTGRLVPDVEGLALWKAPDGGGYLVVSNQGADSFLLYARGGDHRYVGEFFIVAGDAGDGASETDGLEVTSRPLGEAYPDGLLVVQDGRNLAPRAPQNFKFVSWRDVAEALSLD